MSLLKSTISDSRSSKPEIKADKRIAQATQVDSVGMAMGSAGAEKKYDSLKREQNGLSSNRVVQTDTLFHGDGAVVDQSVNKSVTNDPYGSQERNVKSDDALNITNVETTYHDVQIENQAERSLERVDSYGANESDRTGDNEYVAVGTETILPEDITAVKTQPLDAEEMFESDVYENKTSEAKGDENGEHQIESAAILQESVPEALAIPDRSIDSVKNNPGKPLEQQKELTDQSQKKVESGPEAGTIKTVRTEEINILDKTARSEPTMNRSEGLSVNNNSAFEQRVMDKVDAVLSDGAHLDKHAGEKQKVLTQTGSAQEQDHDAGKVSAGHQTLVKTESIEQIEFDRQPDVRDKTERIQNRHEPNRDVKQQDIRVQKRPVSIDDGPVLKVKTEQIPTGGPILKTQTDPIGQAKQKRAEQQGSIEKRAVPAALLEQKPMPKQEKRSTRPTQKNVHQSMPETMKVHIGQIDVFIEAPAKKTQKQQTTASTSMSELASRYYLRSL